MIIFTEESPMKVFLIDDEKTFCYEMKDALDRESSINFLGFANEAKHAYDFISDNSPNVILVDLLLLDTYGLTVVKRIRELDLAIEPYIIMISVDLGLLTKMNCKIAGANQTINKSVEFGVSLIDCLEGLEQDIHRVNLNKTLPQKEIEAKSISLENSRVSRRMQEDLNLLGIKSKYAGYKYIISAVKQCLDEGCSNVRITKDIYPDLAKKYHKKPQDIERGIRTAITRTWQKQDPAVLNKVYNNFVDPEKGAPTNWEFIQYFATKLEGSYGAKHRKFR